MTLVTYKPVFTTRAHRRTGNGVSAANTIINRHQTSAGISVDVIEEKDAYSLYADLPGINEEQLSIQVEENLLTIHVSQAETTVSGSDENSGNGKKETNTENDSDQKFPAQYLIRESYQGARTRSFVLPKDADKENISASLKNGVLTLSIAKLPEQKPKKIMIN